MTILNILVLVNCHILLGRDIAGYQYNGSYHEIDKRHPQWPQVFKTSPGQTEPKMTLGQKFQHGEDTNLFCKPTDVAVLMPGEFFLYLMGTVIAEF
nr:peptidyl-glycine alpha-amidating monooxygenase B-like isoform X1 [Biomphalaria glabrata]